MKKEIFNQIQKITIELIKNTISIAQNYPVIKKGNNNVEEIVWYGFKNISFTLKNLKYDEIYDECRKEREYNFLLLDGAIVQMMYKFEKNNLLKHRLAFYSSPDLERYQTDPETYEERHYGNQLFADVIAEKVIPFPLRFDYDKSDENFIQCDHPYCHSTLGNYDNCRIPVCSPLSPNRFIQFILRSFYFDKYKECFSDDMFSCDLNLERTIKPLETKLLHFNVF
ncbi:MAG: DUF2290 domain-containing protein [Nitrospirae bacterium]|uniref:DUF2290 domain-containing protein n=1 Tax=Candidatus Magnetobacterium casense TaxID=1455061 RepID=UPI00058F49F0|nr:DUF2290 domain-containing protein [Candidatus Magnetobacterium casensis]MBF0337217.1 DUF2290 domain-containing protein [Nitrospirota bacterium]